ncbi:MAG: tetratricopeptide repeat protein [Bacteroidetes bacterium]|nr:tetratricopeptide repeat protein [Bacteroidota bacterium]
MRAAGLVLSALGMISLVLVHCGEETKPDSGQQDGPWLNHSDSVHYVGIEACKECHSDKFETFIETGMGQSFAPASRKKSAANFHGVRPVYDAYSDFYYIPFWRNDSLIFREFRLDHTGDTVYTREERIAYIIGSGQHTNSHIVNLGNFLYQAPLTWYSQEGKWDLPPGFEGGNNSRFSRLIGDECMSCHNALPGFVSNSENKFNTVPHGISCERCHGPGELHIQEKKAGNIVDVNKETDWSIVNPAKLSWELQVDVCQRCHLQGNAVLEPGKSFHDFRPGMPLKSVMSVYMPYYKGENPGFIMASHAQRLQKSKCFLQSNRKENDKGLTCITCHNPHISVKVTGKEVFNKACISCHDQNSCTEAPKTLEKNDFNCVQCHMPSNTTLDIPHVTVHDHYIRKPDPHQPANRFAELLGIYAVNNPDPGLKSRINGYLAYYEKFDRKNAVLLDSAAELLISGGQENIEEWIRLMYLKNDWEALTQIASNYAGTDAWTWYRIGRAYLVINQAGKAEQALYKAVQQEKYSLQFQNEYAVSLIQNHSFNAAQQVLDTLLSWQAKDDKALTNRAYLFELKGDKTKAKDLYSKALSVNPDNLQSLLNLCRLSIDAQEYSTARSLANRIKKIQPNHPALKLIFQKLNN